MNFKDQPIISMRNFSREMIDHILAAAEKMEPIARGEERSDLLSGKILAVLFLNQVQELECLLKLQCSGLEEMF